VSRWLVDKTSSMLAARTSRRGMLFRSAVVGSALATNPVDFVLRPLSAYAAACMCRGQACSCGTACCDGYTEFCCTLTGENTCPSGTVPAGWWRAEGSGLCGGASRYYLDCNQLPNATLCGCACANGSCDYRVTCCTHFRYGQCHQEYPQLGAIVCRVVTCTPPWQFDASCTTADAVDDNTRFHDADCLHQSPTPPPPEIEMPPSPSIAVDSTGMQLVFVRGTDAQLWVKAGTTPFLPLGGILTSGPDAMATPDGRVIVVARGTDGATWQIVRASNGKWGGWTSLGGES
jgi:hypothetical protein